MGPDEDTDADTAFRSGDNEPSAVWPVCLDPGAHTLTLKDSFGDGWSGGSYVTITDTWTNKVVVDQVTLDTGTETTIDFWWGPAPSAPPPSPPGTLPKHERCVFHFTEVVDGGVAAVAAAVGGAAKPPGQMS